MHDNPWTLSYLVLESDGTYYYIAEYLFEGDPHLDNGWGDRGGDGVVPIKREKDLLVAERDIILGFNVPGYE